MNFSTYFQALPVDGRRALAKNIGSSYQYLSHIAKGYRQAGPNMARSIEAATHGAVHRSEMRPDLWEPRDKRKLRQVMKS